jgi:uncharacterized damage-inducible protein DinB
LTNIVKYPVNLEIQTMSTSSALKRHFIRMAKYNKWAYQQLYEKLDQHISESDYRADSGLYFRSIHGSLVHLLLANKLWFSRIEGQPWTEEFPHEINSYWERTPDEWEEAVKDRAILKQHLLEESDKWMDLVEGKDQYEVMFTYQDRKGATIQKDLAEVLDHIFNHQTHHRGQITSAMTKFGGNEASPVLDLVAMSKQPKN